MQKKYIALLFSVLLLFITGCQSAQEPEKFMSTEGAVSENTMEQTTSQPDSATKIQYDSVFPFHEPYGKGIGAMLGRVVWVHDPDSVEWNGEGYWWQLEHFDEAVIQKMVNDGIANLADESNVQSGWDTLFRAHNTSRGKQGGYQRGQKIAIKANINGAGAYADDTKGETHESYANPVLLKALLISLVTEAGVAPGDITVYDAGRVFLPRPGSH